MEVGQSLQSHSSKATRVWFSWKVVGMNPGHANQAQSHWGDVPIAKGKCGVGPLQLCDQVHCPMSSNGRTTLPLLNCEKKLSVIYNCYFALQMQWGWRLRSVHRLKHRQLSLVPRQFQMTAGYSLWAFYCHLSLSVHRLSHRIETKNLKKWVWARSLILRISLIMGIIPSNVTGMVDLKFMQIT